jgi:hypothetical protein
VLGLQLVRILLQVFFEGGAGVGPQVGTSGPLICIVREVAAAVHPCYTPCALQLLCRILQLWFAASRVGVGRLLRLCAFLLLEDALQQVGGAGAGGGPLLCGLDIAQLQAGPYHHHATVVGMDLMGGHMNGHLREGGGGIRLRRRGGAREVIKHRILFGNPHRTHGWPPDESGG